MSRISSEGAERLKAALKTNPTFLPFSVEDFVADTRNVVLSRGEDVGMFEYASPGVYCGHYLFKSRGKEAREVALEMLSEVFKTAVAVRGLVPVTNRAACLATRRLGFKSYGCLDTHIGRCELFIKMKDK